MLRRARVTGIALLPACLLWGCGGSSSTQAQPTATTPTALPVTTTAAPTTSRATTPTASSTVPATLPSDFHLDVAAAVTDTDRTAITEGLSIGQRFFTEAFGKGITGAITVQVTAEAGTVAAQAGGSAMTVNTLNEVWSKTAGVNKRKIVIHELFHIFQSQNGFSAGNPRWFIEGGAEFVAFQGVSYAGLLPYATARGCQLLRLAQGVDGALTLRAGGIPPSGGYWLAFMGIDYMTGGSIAAFAAVVKQPPGLWSDKLAAATGRSPDDFYNGFEATRAAYVTPPRNDCPT